jgi:hypothetical protein
MAGPASDYHRGEMEIHEQTRTYHSFLVLSKWGSLALVVGVLFFSLWFAVGVGFLGSAVTSVVVLVLGIVFLREKNKTPH